MKKQINSGLIAIVGIIAMSILVGCASGPKEKGPKAPEFGAPSDIQKGINTVAEKFPIPTPMGDVSISLEGQSWRATLDGKDLLAGDCIIEDTDEGSLITLNQSWLYVDSGMTNPITGAPLASWVKTPGPEIVLLFKPGPPASLTQIKKDDAAE